MHSLTVFRGVFSCDLIYRKDIKTEDTYIAGKTIGDRILTSDSRSSPTSKL